MYKVGLIPRQKGWISIGSPLLVEMIGAEEDYGCEEGKATNCQHDSAKRVVVSTHP